MGLQSVTGKYRGLQGITKGNIGLQRLKGLQGVTRANKGLQGLKGVTGDYKGLQKVNTG